MTNLKVIVKGKVQGVWFRVKTKDKADELKLSGFVQNEPDGTVYFEVSGDEDTVYKLIKWAQNGSDLADVKSVCIEKSNVLHQGTFMINR